MAGGSPEALHLGDCGSGAGDHRGKFCFDLRKDRRGLDSIDHYECREWLPMNRASDRAVHSPFVIGLYDLALVYENRIN
jgi:hypothetical protein